MRLLDKLPTWRNSHAIVSEIILQRDFKWFWNQCNQSFDVDSNEV
jgi:hypothetical protein